MQCLSVIKGHCIADSDTTHDMGDGSDGSRGL